MSPPEYKLPPEATHRMGNRAAAVILDSIVLAVVYAVGWYLVGGAASSEPIEGGPPEAAAVAVLVVYYTVFEAALGATPGKFIASLRVVDKETLRKPSLGQVFVRNLLRPIDALFGYVIGALVATASMYRQRLGDHAASTLIVDARYETRMQESESLRRRRQAGSQAEQRVSYELSKLACYDGEYYVWDDLYEETVGNIDHLVVGPGGVTIVETKSHKGLVNVEGHGPPTVDGKPLERDVLRQVHNQRLALMRRMGLGDANPDRMRGFNWLICFARGELSPNLAPNVRRRLATLREVRGKIRSQPTEASSEQVRSMANAIEKLYGRGPDHSPSGSKEIRPDGLAGAR